MPELFEGAIAGGSGGGGGGGAGAEGERALYCAIIWASRRTLKVKVNSSLLCSIL